MTKTTVLALGICLMAVVGLLKAEDSKVVKMQHPRDPVEVKLECIGRYLFAVTATGGQNISDVGVSIVQVLEPTKDPTKRFPPQPVLCK